MDAISILTIVFCVVGIIAFMFSIYSIIKIRNMFPQGAKIKNYWNIALYLVALFTLGYVVAIIGVSVIKLQLMKEIMTPIVYLFGSLFVLLIVRLSYQTYKMVLK
ncbi:MAG: hypothetical protein DRG30_07060 [Epsilonproteobacteria bacterium]|nr:MAG: hypothetical protein DRG30_07060 [Campylobacterota bacterium]